MIRQEKGKTNKTTTQKTKTKASTKTVGKDIDKGSGTYKEVRGLILP